MFEIKVNGLITEIYLDGKKLEGVRDIDFKDHVDEPSELTLSIHPLDKNLEEVE